MYGAMVCHGKEVRLIKRKEIGRKGEQVAADFLERRGFTIRDRNFYTRWGELDIVAVEKTEIIHFVEVKTRTGLAYGTPGTAVTYVKQQRIRTAALHWLQQENTYFPQISFDVVEIWVLGENGENSLSAKLFLIKEECYVCKSFG